MLKDADHSTAPASKRRIQVALDLPPDVEEFLRRRAASEFRSFAKEVAMRLIQSTQQEAANAKQA